MTATVTHLARFRITEAHPWSAWHGDEVTAISDGTTKEEKDGTDCDSYLDGFDIKTEDPIPAFSPCTKHKHHVKVKGLWSGTIPTDGLEPLDEAARDLIAKWAADNG